MNTERERENRPGGGALAATTVTEAELAEWERMDWRNGHAHEVVRRLIRALREAWRERDAADPIPAILCCPNCDLRHIDREEWRTRPHRTHLCEQCGQLWRPYPVATVGVQDVEADARNRALVTALEEETAAVAETSAELAHQVTRNRALVTALEEIFKWTESIRVALDAPERGGPSVEHCAREIQHIARAALAAQTTGGRALTDSEEAEIIRARHGEWLDEHD